MNTAAAFDRGARRYDLMVGLNPGYHRELARAADALTSRLGREPQALLDLACGSGASTRALVDAAPEGSYVLGLDASPGMLGRARAKNWPQQVRFERATVGELNLDRWTRGSFDGALACYLFRNVPAERRDHAIAEVFELLRPGGWLCCQEYSVAGNPAAQRVWGAVAHGAIIPLGVVIDRNPGLYRYLYRSVVEFDSVTTFADRLAAAGFVDVAHRTASGWQQGVLHTFIARKPEESS
ncbi:class I SAM-dependent methyltransferase [Tessaracoccus lubricantis]|uniref:Class I SAM-dependent methyltransferase n=1 Tax=Tessaracoccus lubricantis TaxID=545543 RepID=A0ABP9FD03_9ACTN